MLSTLTGPSAVFSLRSAGSADTLVLNGGKLEKGSDVPLRRKQIGLGDSGVQLRLLCNIVIDKELIMRRKQISD